MDKADKPGATASLRPNAASSPCSVGVSHQVLWRAKSGQQGPGREPSCCDRCQRHRGGARAQLPAVSRSPAARGLGFPGGAPSVRLSGAQPSRQVSLPGGPRGSGGPPPTQDLKGRGDPLSVFSGPAKDKPDVGCPEGVRVCVFVWCVCVCMYDVCICVCGVCGMCGMCVYVYVWLCGVYVCVCVCIVFICVVCM